MRNGARIAIVAVALLLGALAVAALADTTPVEGTACYETCLRHALARAPGWDVGDLHYTCKLTRAVHAKDCAEQCARD